MAIHCSVATNDEFLSFNTYLWKEFASPWGHRGKLDKLPDLRILGGVVGEDLGLVTRTFTSTRQILQEIQAVLQAPDILECAIWEGTFQAGAASEQGEWPWDLWRPLLDTEPYLFHSAIPGTKQTRAPLLVSSSKEKTQFISSFHLSLHKAPNNENCSCPRMPAEMRGRRTPTLFSRSGRGEADRLQRAEAPAFCLGSLDRSGALKAVSRNLLEC